MPKPFTVLTCLTALVTCGTLVAAPAVVASGGSEEPASDTVVVAVTAADIDVPLTLHGDTAVAALERVDAVEAVAERSRVEPDELVATLTDDPTAFVSAAGGLLGHVEPAVVGALDDMAPPAQAASPFSPQSDMPADILSLHSRPSATRKIYLDVDGHVTAGQAWNVAYGVPEIVSGPFDLDGNPGSFSAEERKRIFEIWQIVAEDYAPFDVDVTTADPGEEGLSRRYVSDMTYGQRVVITSTDWLQDAVGVRAGGVAYVGVFDSMWDYSAFVFASNLAGGHAKSVGDAASHEAGHSFGLSHDGVTGTYEYYAGHGDWAPIMGVSYNKPVAQWSRGEYPAANRQQDDIEIIASAVGWVGDDHNAAAPTAVSVGSRVDGILSSGDVDVFELNMTSGAPVVRLTPTAGLRSNLHASLTVRNASGRVVGSAAPATAVEWQAAVTVPVNSAGYTVEVRQSAWKTPSTGFSTYGSLGRYTLEVLGADVPATNPPPTTPPTTSPPTTQPPTDGPNTDLASLTPVRPARFLDTRIPVGGSARLTAGQPISVQITGRGPVPTGASAAVLTVTAVNPAAAGYLTLWPCTTDMPVVSTVNYDTGQVVANTTISTLDAFGRVCVYSPADTDVVIDATGWLGDKGAWKLTPVGPTRVADSRIGLGGTERITRAGTTVELDLADAVAPGARAVALNVTAVLPDADGYLTVFPCGSVPPTSTVNYVAGDVRPNNVIVGLNGTSVCVYSSAATDLVVDLTATFGMDGLRYKPAAPIRLADTRHGRTQPLKPLSTVTVNVNGVQLSGATARAVSVNVTAVGHSEPGHVTTFDCGFRPATSTLNQQPGQVAANGAVVPLTDSSACAFLLSGGHLVVDLNGWWVTG